jgi:signal transduction histidine kinase/integral membrane sensor domain MASE1
MEAASSRVSLPSKTVASSRSALPPIVRIIATAVLVAVGYHLGARFGEQLRFLPVTTSVLWPPNAILTATLLLTAPRWWWVYILAAFPAHLLGQPAARPTSMATLLFFTNCSEALLAAVAVRLLGDAPGRFDTLRRMAAFIIGAVLFAPFTSSFADAAVVAGLNGEPYWLVWRTRFFSNMLTELTLVPAIILAITHGRSWLQRASFARRLEAVGLTVLPFGMWALVMLAVEHSSAFRASPGVPLALLLPALSWAAVRFGPGGTSVSLLTTVLLVVWSGSRGNAPISTIQLAEGVLALQIFLTSVGIPLLLLAAVIDERQRAQQALRERLRFEELLSRLSGAFVHVPAHSLDAAFESWLRQLGEFLVLDRVTLYRFSRELGEFIVGWAWSAPGVPAVSRVSVIRDFPWLVPQILREHSVGFARLEELPLEAAREAETFRRRGVRSNLAIPLVAGGRVLGSLAFVTVSSERQWPDELVQRLQLVGEVFANALAQREAEEALRGSEEMKSAILASLASGVAVLDRHGRIVEVNDHWARTARDGGVFGAEVGVEGSFLGACWKAALDGVGVAREAMIGTESVLNGSRTGFSLEYAWGAPGAGRWLALSVVPLKGPDGGAVVSHTDVTERKHAEMEAQRSRQELAHFTRVSTMGELTASLAHELNQPLTGILANAQAAQRFLDARPPDLGEIRAILSDIIDDDKRAGEVIQRLREFLRKGETELSLLDINVLVRDVVKLVSSDALIRSVSIHLDLVSDTPTVSADRVQLQQLILNLLLNAMEAMADCEREHRRVTVRTRLTEAPAVEVAVQDAGTGLRPGTEDLVFEPFYTTKHSGMGMGLSIARSIVEAHGGAIWAANNPTRGATFHFTVPLARTRPA